MLSAFGPYIRFLVVVKIKHIIKQNCFHFVSLAGFTWATSAELGFGGMLLIGVQSYRLWNGFSQQVMLSM
jgi:hypothetical protein